MPSEQSKIVIIGGGTGLSVLVRGLKKHPVDITAIVTVADDGGSSGRLRDELKIPPPGDVRNVLAALSDVEPMLEELFQHRFTTTGDLSGHSLGNLMLSAMTDITGDFYRAIIEMRKVLNVRGKVIPAANQSVVLKAELEDGTIVSGESKIPYSGKKIEKVFLSPSNVEPINEAIVEIEKADLIVIGPGSLYTSILPNLLVTDIGKAVISAKAKKVYVCNVMTQAGETLHYSASDHVKALNQHMDSSFIDTIIVNEGKIPTNILKRYNEELSQQVLFDLDQLNELNLEVVTKPIIKYDNNVIRHDTVKLAEILCDLIPTKVKVKKGKMK
ncbi:gluconeogenesis factor YvcK family protein [Gottfriedia solisilvae]|uniref:Gluconeogenesis factor n=1 Tax=Gottfriedia solisilvae TaxID=1516104 RepID=A0A8J3AU67_9BACI|nr:YvcK family protein [Gottfriedia solisilvae]GGI16203.1 gluconeogenesis factor [Gottfriedia solisilvae]